MTRGIHIEIGLATWMLRIAGIIKDLRIPRIYELLAFHSLADLKRFAKFRNFYEQQRLGQHFDMDDQKNYGYTRQVLREYTLEQAHVVISLFNTGDPTLY